MKLSFIEKIVLTTAVAVPALDIISTILTEEQIYHYNIPDMPDVLGVTITMSLGVYALFTLLYKKNNQPFRYNEPEQPMDDEVRLDLSVLDEEKEY